VVAARSLPTRSHETDRRSLCMHRACQLAASPEPVFRQFPLSVELQREVGYVASNFAEAGFGTSI